MKIVESIRRMEMSKLLKSMFIFASMVGCFLIPLSAIACFNEPEIGPEGGSVPLPTTLVLMCTASVGVYITGRMFKNKKRNKL